MLLIIICIVAGLLALAALFSAIETAITATAPGSIQKLKSEGNRNAKLLLGILKIKDKVISTLLIGNSIANTLCTTIATGVFIEFLGDDIGTIASSIVMSILIIVFSEVIPKAIAVVKAEKIALMFTQPLILVLKILEPVNFLLSYAVKGFCFIFRIDLNQIISATDEVRGVIEHHMNEGNVFKDDRDMLGGILDIRNMEVSEIMIHRSKVVSLEISTPINKIIKTIFASTHSRFPFWEKTHDNIIGVLHVKDLMYQMQHIKDNPGVIDIRSLLSEPIFVPDNSLVIQQLHMFKEGQTHLAFVVDEYGGLEGIITLEDILEEIVGQIYDEHDLTHNKIAQISEHVFIIDGSMPIRDINRELNWQIPDDDATTLAGLIIHKMQKIPDHGEYLMTKDLKMIVEKKSSNRIQTVKVIVQTEPDQAENDT